MKILITGGTGFFGAHLAKRLIFGNEVSVVARGMTEGYLSGEDLAQTRLIKCDLKDKKALRFVIPEGIDLVIHCAAKIDIPKSSRCPEDLIETNLNSTINLVECMVDKGIKRLLYCSSMTVYGMENDIPVKESGRLSPVHFYGLSKKWAEEAIKKYAEEGFVQALVMRYPGLYGYPKASGYIYNLSRRLLRNETVEIDTEGLKFWEAMNIKDAVEITAKLLDVYDWEKQFDSLNCSYGEEVDFVETAFALKGILNASSDIKVKKPIDYVRFYMDNRKIRGLVGCENGFKMGLKDYINRHSDWIKQ